MMAKGSPRPSGQAPINVNSLQSPFDGPLPTLIIRKYTDQPDSRYFVAEANGSAANLFEYSQEELRGLAMRHLIIPEAVAYIESLAPAFNDDKHINTYAEISTKTGKRIPVAVSAKMEIKEGLVEGHVVLVNLQTKILSESHLMEAQARFLDIIEDIFGLILRTKPDGTITFCNNSFGDFVGTKSSELFGKSIKDVYPANISEVLLTRWAAFTATNNIYKGSLAFDAGPTPKYLNWLERGVFDQSGTLIEIQSVGQDITESVLATRKTELAKKRFELAFSMAPYPSLLLSYPDFSILEMNHTFSDQFSVPDIVSQCPVDVLDVPGLTKDQISSFIDPKASSSSWEFTHSSQGFRKLFSVSAILVDLDIYSKGILLTFKDITQDREYEYVQEISMAAADALGIGVGIVERSNSHYEFKYANHVLSDTLGLNDKTILKMDLSAILTSDLSDIIGDDEIVSEPKDIWLIDSHGRRILVVLAIARINFKNRQALALYVRSTSHLLRDDSDFRKKDALQSLGALAGSIAHDFNNRIQIITLMAQHAISMANINNIEQCVSDSHQILAACGQAKDLVDQILGFTRQETEFEVYSVLDSIKKSASVLNFTSDTNAQDRYRVSLIYDLPTTEDLCVVGNPAWLDQIILNLGTNAVKAMPSGGEIRIKIRKLTKHSGEIYHPEFDHLAPGLYTQILFEDQGIGIKSNLFKKIFEPFFTLSKSSRKGVGLGLYSVKHCVYSFGGALRVSSEVGRGTSFELLLPSHIVAVHDRLTKGLDHLFPGGNETILLVDDEPSLLSIMSISLSELGYNVLSANSGAKALNIFDSSCVDLLITDQVMPGMSGIELAQKLLSRKPGLPIILYTGFSDSVSPGVAKKIGIKDFLVKPVHLEKVCASIRNLLDPILPIMSAESGSEKRHGKARG